MPDARDETVSPRRKYVCVRCDHRERTEQEMFRHLEAEHSGQSDGKYDYSVNITEEYP